MLRIRHLLALLVGLSAAFAAQPASGAEKPFRLPFDGAPGPNSWLLEQHYGSTREAFTYGRYWYAYSQGLHAGIDLEARCGTPVVAIGNGEVMWVNNSNFGAEPNNLVIRHFEAGYVSVYGHLLERPTLIPGQPVRAGQVIGKVGDPDLTCLSRPHLHLEIRSLDYRTAFNPASLIDANWDALALLAEADGIEFARNLNAPNRWQSLFSQPEIVFGNNRANAFSAIYPPTERFRATPPTLPAFSAPAIPAGIGGRLLPVFQRLSAPGCCVQPFFSADSRTVFYVDTDPTSDSAAVFAAEGDVPARRADSVPPAIYAAGGRLRIAFPNGQTRLENLVTGAAWLLPARGTEPVFSPEGKYVLWHVRPGDYLPGYALPRTEIWLAHTDDPDAENAALIRLQAGGAVYWLDEDRLLLAENESASQKVTLSLFWHATGQITPLGRFDFLRGLQVAPGGGRVLFLLPFQADDTSGLYTLETRPGARAEQLPFVGAVRWRDSQSLYYVPTDDPTAGMSLRLYDLDRGADRLLVPPGTRAFAIANADWHVSPDGTRLAFVSAHDGAIWRLHFPATPIPLSTPADF